MDKKPVFTLEELAKLTESKIAGDPKVKITGYADLDSADENDISFLSNPRFTNTRYVNAMKQSRAGAIFIAPKMEMPEGKNFLINEDPSRAFQKVIETIRGGIPKKTEYHGMHPSAVIHDTCTIGKNVTIGPHAVLDAGVTIGDKTFIGAGTYIGPQTTIGTDCEVNPNVTIHELCTIGNRVVLHTGCVIGSCGFGFTTDTKGRHTRLKHVGIVIIEDDVEIGCNTTVDRGRFTETRISQGSKIDNLVVVGHNVRIGRHNIICGQTGMAGSTQTGNHVVIAGQCGIEGHIKLADGVVVAAKSGVTKSLEPGKYAGFPAEPLDKYNRHSVLLRNIEGLLDRVKKLEDSQ